jgi:membrane protein
MTTRRPRKPRRWTLELFAAAYHRLSRHGGDSLAAGLAFGSLLSVAPLLLIVLAVLSLIVGEGTAREEALALVHDSLGGRAAPVFAGWIDDARVWSATATVLGVVLFVFGAARLVALVDSAFEVVFEVPHEPPIAFWKAVRRYFATQLLSFGVTLVAGFLITCSLLVRIAVPAVLGSLEDGPLGDVWWVGRSVLSFALLFLSLALVYRVLPPRKLDRGDVLEGALVSTVALHAAFILLRWLTARVDFGAAYGAAGAIVGMLVALYVAAQLFLFGAELTAELAHRRRVGKPSEAGKPFDPNAPTPAETELFKEDRASLTDPPE